LPSWWLRSVSTSITEPGLARGVRRSVPGCLAALLRRSGLGGLRGFGRLRRFVRRGFFRLGRVAGKVVLLFLVGFAIGLVPAAAGQAERRRGHLPLHGVVLAATAGNPETFAQ